MNSHYIIHAALLAIISLLVWMVLYVIWGSGNDNAISQLFKTQPIQVVYRDNTPVFETNTTSGESVMDQGSQVSVQTQSQTASSNDTGSRLETHQQKDNQLTVVIDTTRPNPNKSTQRENITQNRREASTSQRVTGQTAPAPSNGSGVTIVRQNKTPPSPSNPSTGNSSQATSAISTGQQSTRTTTASTIADSDADIRGATAIIRSAKSTAIAVEGKIVPSAKPLGQVKAYSNASVRDMTRVPEPVQSVAQTTQALTLTLDYDPENCSDDTLDAKQYNIHFRHESAAIKGFSLLEVDNMIAFYGRCEEADFTITHHPDGAMDATSTLRQRRRDELFYHLLHMRVEKSDIATVELTQEQP